MVNVNEITNAGIYENTVGEVASLFLSNGENMLPIYRVDEYANMLGCSSKTVRQYIDEGKLIGIKIGRLWFIQSLSFASVREGLDELPF